MNNISEIPSGPRKSLHQKNGLLQFIDKIRVFLTSKRQKFILVVLLLSFLLFFSENIRFTRGGVLPALILGFLTNILFLWSNFRDIKENFSFSIFILPFFFSLSFGLFYLLLPARFLTNLSTSVVYGIGLYSLFLSQNIFIVASIRTIALLSSARTVSFILTLIAFFFITNTIFSLHASIWITSVSVFITSFFLVHHALWTHTLEKSIVKNLLWTTVLSLCLFELCLTLWFWPSSPTALALFLTGVFYTIVGLSYVWLDKRLFRGVMWEYAWVIVIAASILILSTFLNS